MGEIDELINSLKKQAGQRYRLVRLDSGNVTRKKVRGYNFVSSQDPEVKGTILEQHKGADGLIRVGNLALARIKEADARKQEAKVRARTETKLAMIERTFRDTGDNLKRQAGKKHKAIEVVYERQED